MQTSSSCARPIAVRALLHVLPNWADRALSGIRPSDVDDWTAESSRKMGGHSARVAELCVSRSTSP